MFHSHLTILFFGISSPEASHGHVNALKISHIPGGCQYCLTGSEVLNLGWWVDSKGLGTCLCSPAGLTARNCLFFNYLCLWVCGGKLGEGDHNTDIQLDYNISSNNILLAISVTISSTIACRKQTRLHWALTLILPAVFFKPIKHKSFL